MQRISLTDSAHHCILEYLRGGGLAIDATIGNGHDTVFLAQLVGANGHVYGFDVQVAALVATTQRLQQQQMQDRVTLYQTSHADMGKHIPVDLMGSIKAIMFNLGYLPGTDKSIITRPESTLQALSVACGYLSPQGIMTVIAYPGHDGGNLETCLVQDWLSLLDPNLYAVESILSRQHQAASPRLFVIRKQT